MRKCRFHKVKVLFSCCQSAVFDRRGQLVGGWTGILLRSEMEIGWSAGRIFVPALQDGIRTVSGNQGCFGTTKNMP